MFLNSEDYFDNSYGYNHTARETIEILKRVQTFYYPSTEIVGRKSDSLEQLTDYIDGLPIQPDFRYFKFPFTKRELESPMNKKTYIRFVCPFKKFGCQAGYRLTLCNGVYKVFSVSGYHYHDLERGKRSGKFLKQLLKAKIKKYHLDPEVVVKYLVENCGINVQRQQYLLKDIVQKMNYAQFEETIRKSEFAVWTYPQQYEGKPIVLVGIPNYMVEQPQTIHDVVFIKFIEAKISTDSLEKGQLYGVLFVGNARNGNNIIFGGAIVKNKHTLTIVKLVQGFISLSTNKPGVFITDDIPQFQLAFRQLRKNGTFTGLHIISDAKIIDRFNSPNDIRRLLSSTSKQQYQYWFQKLKLTEDSQELEKLNRNAHLYCVGCMKSSQFIGSTLAIKDKYGLRYFNYINKAITPLKFFFKINNFSKKIIKSPAFTSPILERHNYQKILNDQGVGFVRGGIPQATFNYFLSIYTRAFDCSFVKKHQNMYIIETIYGRYEVWLINGYFYCRCRYAQKSGIICEHIVKAMWSQDHTNYIEYFDGRWKVDNLRFPKALGRPKKTRKNKIT